MLVILVYVSIRAILTVKIHYIQTTDFMHKTEVTKHILNKEPFCLHVHTDAYLH